MKLLISIALSLLVLIGGGSGYYIWKLTGEINDLEASIDQSLDDLSDNLSNQLESRNDSFFDTINQTQFSAALYADSVERDLTEIRADILNYSSALSKLNSTDDRMEDSINDSTIHAWKHYDTVRKSIVSISEGGNILGTGFLCSTPKERSDKTYILRQEIITTSSIAKYYREKRLHFIISNHIPYPHDLYVTLWNGNTYRVYVNSICESLHIALLQIDFDIESLPKRGLPTFDSVEFADSDKARPGDPVFIISNLDGIAKGFITTGVVSGINRYIKIGDSSFTNLIQFDASVNFGGMGCPVFNKDGKVIGMTIARINPLIGDNMGFAVPSDQLNRIKLRTERNNFPILLYDHIYFYPWTGIIAEDINPKDIVTDNNTIVSGIKVVKAVDPATSAGIRIGDIITKIDNTPVYDCNQFFSCLAKTYFPGDEIILVILRDGEISEINLKLEEYHDEISGRIRP